MKRLSLFLFIIVFASSMNGQKSDGYVVTNVNDTIYCKFFAISNMLNQKTFFGTSVYNYVKILTEKGEKVKYYPKDIICFVVTGATNGSFKFVGFKHDNYKHFYHEVVGDRLSYYRLYNRDNSYSGSNQTYKEYILKDDYFLELGMFNTRKNLAQLIKDNEEIYGKWMDENGYYKLRDAFNIINQYNNWYKGKYSILK